jgi:uncharacterized membrane protein
MATFLASLPRAVGLGVVLVIAFWVVYAVWPYFGGQIDYPFCAYFFRYLHVLSGIMWIGLLWYFNFVQTPGMPKIPDDQKPAISKVIAPSALFWFRWGAMSTIVTGLILAYLNGYLGPALGLGIPDHVAKHTFIGIGMWLGIIMWFNVWFLIWPNQKKILGIVSADAAQKAAAAKIAGAASRINTVLSVPMLAAMVGAQNLY